DPLMVLARRRRFQLEASFVSSLEPGICRNGADDNPIHARDLCFAGKRFSTKCAGEVRLGQLLPVRGNEQDGYINSLLLDHYAHELPRPQSELITVLPAAGDFALNGLTG